MTKTITKGTATASIRKNADDDFYVLVTRGGQCLPGIPGRHYFSLKTAERGAASMLSKV